MIEVEKSFLLDEKTEKRLMGGAEFISKEIIKDIYYDNDNHDITTKDRWLRKRDGKWELKIPAVKQEPVSKRVLDRYEEITSEDRIQEVLKLEANGALDENLEANGFFPIVAITTTRSKYKKSDFIIDIDEVDFDPNYRVGEIELIVEDESQIEAASKKILEFVKASGLNLNYLPLRGGKVQEYLRRNNPKLYADLIEAGVV
ncbi:CYTH domain-containing protein [Candidatus Wolfebacteria bacterium]|nr:CYTH domain-containing protein [Candidatus Wolfebacteria bacterium]